MMRGPLQDRFEIILEIVTSQLRAANDGHLQSQKVVTCEVLSS